MDILVGVHVVGDWDDGINVAKISLDEAAIKCIFQLSKGAGKNTLSCYDYSPELGTTDLDLDNNGPQYRDLSKLSEEERNLISDGCLVFKDAETRKDCVQLYVNDTDFWWTGLFKHTEIAWETALIPLAFLPQEFRATPAKKVQSGSLPDLNMTAEEMNAIHEKIAAGINQGLNAREIDATFQRHVTKAQLIRLLMEHIERNH
jgi:hypothetical protein